MSISAFSKLAAVIFTVMALGQLGRAVSGLTLQVGTFGVPKALSYLACVVLAVLAYLGYAAR